MRCSCSPCCSSDSASSPMFRLLRTGLSVLGLLHVNAAASELGEDTSCVRQAALAADGGDDALSLLQHGLQLHRIAAGAALEELAWAPAKTSSAAAKGSAKAKSAAAKNGTTAPPAAPTTAPAASATTAATTAAPTVAASTAAPGTPDPSVTAEGIANTVGKVYNS